MSHGKSLLLKYSKNGFYRKDQNVLVDIIISNEPDSRLLRSKLNPLAEGIVELFPNEKKEMYFTKVNRKIKDTNMQTGRDKLFSKYFNLRRTFKKNWIDFKQQN